MTLSERELQIISLALTARSDALYNKISKMGSKPVTGGMGWKGYWMTELRELEDLQAKITAHRSTYYTAEVVNG